MPPSESFYETDTAISEYLVFHYGEASLFRGPADSLDFAARCAALAARHPVEKGRALDLGCAVGRAACELSAHFESTLGIDFSHGLIEAAQRLCTEKSVVTKLRTEGEIFEEIQLALPPNARPDRLQFQQGDATQLPSDLGRFDFVLMANLIDRLPDPEKCLSSIGDFINDDGILAITSPYTWMEAYTPKSKWLGGYRNDDGSPVYTYESLQRILSKQFDEIEAFDMPFLIREHSRKNQYTHAHATLWRKR